MSIEPIYRGNPPVFKILLNNDSKNGKNVIISLSMNSSDMPSIPGDLHFFNFSKVCIISHDVMLLFSMLFAISCFILYIGFSSSQLFFFKEAAIDLSCGGVFCFKKKSDRSMSTTSWGDFLNQDFSGIPNNC